MLSFSPQATNNLPCPRASYRRIWFFREALTCCIYHFSHVPFTLKSQRIRGTQWKRVWRSERIGDDILEWKLISNLSEETLSLSLPQAVLSLLNDLIIALLLLFLLILIYYVYSPPLLTVNLTAELGVGLEYFEGCNVFFFFFYYCNV